MSQAKKRSQLLEKKAVSRDGLVDHLQANIDRVVNLIGAHDSFKQSIPYLRASSAFKDDIKNLTVQIEDLLRAATVLLHASLEDFIRSLIHRKLPLASAEALKDIRLIDKRDLKFTLCDLSVHRGKTVEKVIKESIDAHLEHSNYNNTTELMARLSDIGIKFSSPPKELATINELMLRRHQIVHRADRNPIIGRGKITVRTIDTDSVKAWVNAVVSFANKIVRKVAGSKS